MKTGKRIVIIGSGLGGLSCAYILQKNGYEVSLLEQGNQVGGCLQCFCRGGSKFETGMHFIGSAAKGQTLHALLKFLSLDGLPLCRLDPLGYNTIAIHGGEFRIPNGKENFIDRFGGLFPKEKDALVRYTNIIDKIAQASQLKSLKSGGSSLSLDSEFSTMSINGVMSSIFRDEVLKDILVGDLPLYSARKDRTPFSLHAFIMDFYNRSAWRVAGGSDGIASSLQGNIERMGGQILTRRKAVKIRCRDKYAEGVECSDGSFFEADYVIGAIHPKRVLELLDTKLIKPAFRERICSMSQTAGVFALYVKFKKGMVPYMNTNLFAYNSSSPWGCETYTEEEWPKNFLYMHMCHEMNPVQADSGVVMAYMNIADVEKWKHLPCGHRGPEYEAFKKNMAERLIAAVESRRPGFRQALDSYYCSTPLTYLDYTGTEDGSIYGIAKDISPGGGGHVSYRTKLPNLFLAGQNVNSHGIFGVIVGTLVTCSAFIGSDNLYHQIFE